jgi:hypothetical protein
MKMMNESFEDSTLSPSPDSRGDLQKDWHEYFARWLGDYWLTQHTHLDVGSGLGLIRERYPNVRTQDIARGLDVDYVVPVFDIRQTFDLVTCFDVIEHVIHENNFLESLCKIATEWLIITTPNWNVSKCANKYHVREYKPVELCALFDVCNERRCVYYYFARDGRDISYHLTKENFFNTPLPDLGIAVHFESY